jgi:hypothetical protein
MDGVGWEEDRAMFERRYIEAHKDSLCGVRGCVERCQEQDDVAQLSLHLGVDPARHETLSKRSCLVGFADVYQVKYSGCVCRTQP